MPWTLALHRDNVPVVVGLYTHASLLINSDVAARVIADRLGHSTTKTTLDTYSHVFAESEVKAMAAVDMKLFAKAGND